MDIVLPPDFKDFLKLLNVKKIRYLLIGGYAVGYHGYPRATNDTEPSMMYTDNGFRCVGTDSASSK